MSFSVFYLDDEEDLCEIFLDQFSSEEIDITTFTSPKKIIEAVKINPPNLIFLDYRLPSTNGDEVAQAMDTKIPKFLVTGDISVSTKYEFTKILQKPYKNLDIISILNFYKDELKKL